MLFRAKTWAALAVVLPSLAACNDNSFSGSGSGATKEDASGEQNCDDPNGCGASEEPKECVSGDKVNIKWTGPVGDCIGQGKTYNFEEKKCAEMNQAQFDCNWGNVKAELEKRSLLTDVLREDSENGGKLVTCGQSGDGNRIVVQWIKAEDAQGIDCNDGNSSHHITTGCYTVYTSKDEQPPQANSKEEKSQQVFDCMNKL